ncbi:hypothetical protein J4457_06600 [Candidatus Woesearchaeota archaeon]|nr:hypothetical protein [Candidatus Woesearchaeota archaeon]
MKKKSILLLSLLVLLLQIGTSSGIVLGPAGDEHDYFLRIGYSCPGNAALPTIDNCGWANDPVGDYAQHETCYQLDINMQMQGDDLVINHYRCSTIGQVWRSSDITPGSGHNHR